MEEQTEEGKAKTHLNPLNRPPFESQDATANSEMPLSSSVRSVWQPDSSSPQLVRKTIRAIRARYLGYLRDIAENWLDWKKLGPVVAQFQKTIDADLKADTKKLFATDVALRAVTEDGVASGSGPTAPPQLSLKSFCEQRRKYLLAYPGIKR